MIAFAENYPFSPSLLETMQQTNRCHKQQGGSVLLLILITLSTLLFIVLASTDRTVQHTHLLFNYQHHFKALKDSELCLINSVNQISKLDDARFWSKNIKPSSRGLYNRASQPPIDIEQFDWSPTNTDSLDNGCRYIIEYLGTISDQKPSSATRHILRISILYQARKPFKIALQVILSVIFNKNELPSIVFRQPPTLQQWVRIH